MSEMKRANAFDETAQVIKPPAGLYRNEDGSVLAAAAASGKFGLVSNAWGVGGHKLQGEAASGNSKTSTVKLLVPLPQNYVAASTITLKVTHRVSVIANTTANVDAEVRKTDGNGGVGSDQVTTSAQTNNTTGWVTSSFTVTGTSFSPGDEVEVFVRSVVDDSGGANSSKSEIGAIWFETTTRM